VLGLNRSVRQPHAHRATGTATAESVGEPLRSTCPSAPGDHSTSLSGPTKRYSILFTRSTPPHPQTGPARIVARPATPSARMHLTRPAITVGCTAHTGVHPQISGPALGSDSTVTQVGGPYTKDMQYGYRYRQVVQRGEGLRLHRAQRWVR